MGGVVEWDLGFITHTPPNLPVQLSPSSHGPPIGKQCIYNYMGSNASDDVTTEVPNNHINCLPIGGP